MKQYQIVLRDRTPIIFTGDVILFNDSETFELISSNAIYLNTKDIIFIRTIEEEKI